MGIRGDLGVAAGAGHDEGAEEGTADRPHSGNLGRVRVQFAHVADGIETEAGRIVGFDECDRTSAAVPGQDREVRLARAIGSDASLVRRAANMIA